MELKGFRALVTGASRGLGAAVATGLAAAGADVAVHYQQDREGVERTAAAVSAAGGRTLLLQADLADPAAVTAMLDRLQAEWGALDLVVNNAGQAPVLPWDTISLEDWDRCLAVNLSGPFHVLRGTLPLLSRAGGRGSAVNVGSVVSFNGGSFGPAYAAAKAGLIGLTRSAARDWGPRGVRVNCVAPGPLDSALARQLPSDLLRQMAAATPLQRLGNLAEVAAAIIWLLSPSASYVNGQTLVVDGGRIMD